MQVNGYDLNPPNLCFFGCHFVQVFSYCRMPPNCRVCRYGRRRRCSLNSMPRFATGCKRVCCKHFLQVTGISKRAEFARFKARWRVLFRGVVNYTSEEPAANQRQNSRLRKMRNFCALFCVLICKILRPMRNFCAKCEIIAPRFAIPDLAISAFIASVITAVINFFIFFSSFFADVFIFAAHYITKTGKSKSN